MSASTAAALRRHNSVFASVVEAPTKLSLPHRTSSFELISYTSLRDVLPSPNAAVNSPTASSAAIISDISIRNRLVKHAAWAYLQPMSASPSASSAPHFLRRICHSLSAATACLSFLVPYISRISHRILQALSLRGQEVVSTSS